MTSQYFESYRFNKPVWFINVFVDLLYFTKNDHLYYAYNPNIIHIDLNFIHNML